MSARPGVSKFALAIVDERDQLRRARPATRSVLQPQEHADGRIVIVA